MMREGTTSRTTQQISELLETKAATVAVDEPGLRRSTATVSGSSLTENFDDTFALAADILLNPVVPAGRARSLPDADPGGPRHAADEPGVSRERDDLEDSLRHASGGADLAHRGGPDEGHARRAWSTAHRTRFVPDHAVIAIAGDISMADARKAIDARLGAWKKAGTPAPAVSRSAGDRGRRRSASSPAPNSVQTSLWVGTQAISRMSPDYDIVQVMNEVLGGGPTGRLFTHLREEKGYTYGAYSNISAGQFRGSWTASTDVRTEVTEPALRDLVAEITRMRNEPVPTKEFEDRKRGMVASFALSLESPAAVLNNHVTRWLYKLPADYWDKYPDRVMAVTVADVQAAAKKYLDPARLQIVAVGDPTKVATILPQFGTVETFDTNGRVDQVTRALRLGKEATEEKLEGTEKSWQTYQELLLRASAPGSSPAPDLLSVIVFLHRVLCVPR